MSLIRTFQHFLRSWFHCLCRLHLELSSQYFKVLLLIFRFLGQRFPQEFWRGGCSDCPGEQGEQAPRVGSVPQSAFPQTPVLWPDGPPADPGTLHTFFAYKAFPLPSLPIASLHFSGLPMGGTLISQAAPTPPPCLSVSAPRSACNGTCLGVLHLLTSLLF